MQFSLYCDCQRGGASEIELPGLEGASLNFLQSNNRGGTSENPPGFGLRQSSGALDVASPARETCVAHLQTNAPSPVV
jgi:hypothetical protein